MTDQIQGSQLKPDQNKSDQNKSDTEDFLSSQEKTEVLKEACEECSGHHELDTSKGDFTTIAVGILMALICYSLIPPIVGIRLGDYSPVIVYGLFLVLVLFFWFLAEKIKAYRQSHHQNR